MTYIARPTGRVVPPGELLAELTARIEAPHPRLKTGRRRQRRLLRLTGGVGLVMTMMFASLAFAVHDETFELDGNTADDAGGLPAHRAGRNPATGAGAWFRRPAA